MSPTGCAPRMRNALIDRVGASTLRTIGYRASRSYCRIRLAQFARISADETAKTETGSNRTRSPRLFGSGEEEASSMIETASPVTIDAAAARTTQNRIIRLASSSCSARMMAKS